MHKNHQELSFSSRFLKNVDLKKRYRDILDTHFNVVEQDLPSQDAIQIANNLTNLGQMYNREDISTDNLVREEM